jgi:hypothetical protein
MAVKRLPKLIGFAPVSGRELPLGAANGDALALHGDSDRLARGVQRIAGPDHEVRRVAGKQAAGTLGQAQ